MGLTLNGIAQGWITDRVADLLRAAGVTSSLVDMGEIRAVGDAGGHPWRVAVEPDGAILALADRAVATSAADGFRFDAAGRFGHILDPRTGAPAAAAARATVTAPDAATADALATALTFLDAPSTRAALAAFPLASAEPA
jgi:thiamine biosynthesis lipoprotein